MRNITNEDILHCILSKLTRIMKNNPLELVICNISDGIDKIKKLIFMIMMLF